MHCIFNKGARHINKQINSIFFLDPGANTEKYESIEVFCET